MNAFLIGVIISFIIYLIVGFVVSRTVKTADDFFVSGRNAPVGLIVGSMTASLLSTGLFLGDTGEAYNAIFFATTGCAAVSAGGYILGAVFFSRFLRRSEAYTVPQFFERRFQSRKIGILAAIVAVVAMGAYTLSVTQGGATVFSNITGVDYKICIILFALTYVIMIFAAGSKGVLISDTIMFGVFLIAGLCGVFFVCHEVGGLWHGVETIAADPELHDVLSWHGVLGYMYATPAENLIWIFMYGLCWSGVAICAPWQCSRNQMAKDESTIIRASIFVIIGCFAINYIVQLGAVMFRLLDIGDTEPTQIWLWCAQNIMPKFLGVVLVTGIIAAAISSCTTFMSLCGSTIANDFFHVEGDKKKVSIARWSMVCLTALVVILGIAGTEKIWWIMQIGANGVVGAFLPVALASVWSKKVTKTGAFAGMLVGFIVVVSMKIGGVVAGYVWPIFLDPFLISTLCNIIAMVIGDRMSTITEEEIAYRDQLHVTPETEKDPVKIKKARNAIHWAIVIAIGITVFTLLTWTIPYRIGVGA